MAEEEIIKTMRAQEEAWNEGDVEGFMQAYWKSDSLLFIGSSGPQYGWQTTLDKYKKSYPDQSAMGTLSFSNIQFQLIENETAHLSGKWQLDRASDTLKGYYSLLWRKIEEEWKVVYDHSSSIKN